MKLTKLINPQESDIYSGVIYPVKIKVLEVDRKNQRVIYLNMENNKKYEVGLALFEHLQLTKL